MFYAELIQRQDSSAKAEVDALGTLDLIVGYLKDKNSVEVTVVQARNLPKVSKNGKEKLNLYYSTFISVIAVILLFRIVRSLRRVDSCS